MVLEARGGRWSLPTSRPAWPAYDSRLPDVSEGYRVDGPQRHLRARVWVVRTYREGATHDEHYHDRPRHRQGRVPSARRERGREGRGQAQAAQGRGDLILRSSGSLHGGHGGVRGRASLGPRADRPGARGEAGRARGGAAVREEGQEERRRRRGRAMRGRIAARCAVRAGQELGAASHAGPAHGARCWSSSRPCWPTPLAV